MLLAAIHLTAGQQPRRSELVPVKWTNAQHALRNFIICGGRFATKTAWSKQHWRGTLRSTVSDQARRENKAEYDG